MGPSCLIFNLWSAGKAADLALQPPSCSELDGLLGEQPWGFIFDLLATCVSVSFPPRLSWEKKALPDLDFSWAPQVLPLIGRLISNLVTGACKGRRHL